MRRWPRTFALGAVFLGCAAFAQTHKVTAPQKVVRAVGVYEWTGDLAKPAGARLIPVTLFIDGRLQDADVYRANPIPFALDTGNVYELQKSGIAQGTLAIAFTRKLVPTTKEYSSWDDGWFGYGKFVPPTAAKPSNLKPTATLAKINAVDDENDDKPHFSARSAAPGSGGAAAPVPGSAPAASRTPADDPDRPTLHRGSSDKSAASDVPDDPDRPTLHKHSGDAETPSSQPVRAVTDVTGDPDRPTLHRGKPAYAFTEADLPKLTGLPADKDLQQMAAVSDAADHPPHDFSRPWDDEAERTTILGKMQDAARTALAAYEKANGLAPTNAAPPPPPDAAPALKRTPATAAHRAATKKATPAPPPPLEPLMDEKLTGYLLSYGGAPTFVYSAHTDGLGPAQRFVTIVAQNNMQGQAEIVLKNVTDAAHLDRTPRMKLVDAVDAEASNRASLLFELRAQSARQFALYRVLGGRADQTFLTGSTQ